MQASSPFLHAQPAKLDASRLTLALCLALPWLNGFTAGPSPNFWPLWGAAVLGIAVLLQWRKLDAACMAQAWLAAALVSSLMAVLQYFGLAAALAPWVSPSELGQSYANLRQRNQFASLTSIGLVSLLVMQAWHARPESVPRRGLAGLTALAAAAALLLALGNATSSSRTGFLQWALILLVLLGAWLKGGGLRCRRPGAALGLSLWAFACYALLLMVLPRSLLAWQGADIGSMAERLVASGQDSRRLIWENVAHLIAQKPWSGWGWGELDYAHFMTVYPGLRFSELLDHAHNLPLQLAVELGVPAALAICLGLALWVWRAQPWREREPGRLLAWGVLAIIGIHSLLEYPLWYGPFHWAALLCIVWLGRTRHMKKGLVSGEVSGLARKARWGLACICWMALALTALDYARVSQLYRAPAERWRIDSSHPLAISGSGQGSAGSVFFQSEIDFARLTTTPVSLGNAPEIHALALSLLHYSPEPRVVEPLIASAVLLGKTDDAAAYLVRYRRAFSDDMWRQLLARTPSWTALGQAG